MKKLIIFFIIFNSFLSFGEDINQNNSSYQTKESTLESSSESNLHNLMGIEIPSIPTTGRDINEKGEIRLLEKTFTVMLESKVNVFVPLEVITDINIEGTVIGDQVLDIPFDIELNRKPEKENYYSIKYNENLLDLDNDGLKDTYIYSPKYINDKISKDNFVRVYGENISKEGTHKKDVYITVEVGH